MSPDQPENPRTLGELLNYVIDDRGYNSLAELARHTSIAYQTLWAWQQGTRNLKRPPAAPVLLKLAADLGLPPELVFHAAGRTWTGDAPPDAGDLDMAHLSKQLTPAQKRAVMHLMRDLLGEDGPEEA